MDVQRCAMRLHVKVGECERCQKRNRSIYNTDYYVCSPEGEKWHFECAIVYKQRFEAMFNVKPKLLKVG